MQGSAWLTLKRASPSQRPKGRLTKIGLSLFARLRITKSGPWSLAPWALLSMDVDRDHDLASRLLVDEFGEPAAKVKSPSARDIITGIPSHRGYWLILKWLCGDVRGTEGYIIPWHLEELLDQLENHNCLRRLNLADIRAARISKVRSQRRPRSKPCWSMLTLGRI